LTPTTTILLDLGSKLGRYGLTAGLTYLTATGRINEGVAAMINTFAIDAVGYTAAALPPIYVAYKAFRAARSALAPKPFDPDTLKIKTS